MVTIYERQRKRLNLSVPEYAQLYNTTCLLINRVLNGKEMSEDMGISKILREKFNKRYDEIENNQIETTLEILSNKEKNEKEEKEILDWYNNEFAKKKLYEKTNVSSVPVFMENYDIYVDGHKASKWYYATIINKDENQLLKLRKDRLIEFIKQLKDIMDDENFIPVEIKQLKTTPSVSESEMKFLYDRISCYKEQLGVEKLCSLIGIHSTTYFKTVYRHNFHLQKGTYQKLKNFVDKMENGDGAIIDDGEELSFEENENENKSKEYIAMTPEKILEVYKDFNYFAENNSSASIKDFCRENKVGYGIYYNKIKKNDINITRPTFLKLQKIVDELKQGQLETIQDTETPCVMSINAESPRVCLLDDEIIVEDKKEENKDNYEVLRKLLKDRLTEEEKNLILIFGGKID